MLWEFSFFVWLETLLYKNVKFKYDWLFLFYCMAYSEDVKNLAETLRNSGLSASMTDALERAQNMIGRREAKEEPEVREAPAEKKMDVTQTTLDVSEAEENRVEEFTETDGELKEDEVFTNKPDAELKKEEPSTQKKIDYSKEKKIDLSDVFNVNK